MPQNLLRGHARERPLTLTLQVTHPRAAGDAVLLLTLRLIIVTLNLQQATQSFYLRLRGIATGGLHDSRTTPSTARSDVFGRQNLMYCQHCGTMS